MQSTNSIFPKLESFIQNLDYQSISNDRKETLQVIIEAIQTKIQENKALRLHCICTHNSRRSHLTQIWSQKMAFYYRIPMVNSYSGGTEATAIYNSIIETLEHTGFTISKRSEGSNPIYSIKYAPNEPAIIGFSKTIEDTFNPSSEFMAIMTCDSAYEACPVVIGAEHRFPLLYEDPKAFDNTPLEQEKYAERSRQIATEMGYLFSNLK